MRNKIGVIGAGSWGDALSVVFSKNMHVIQYSKRDSKKPIASNILIKNDFESLSNLDYVLIVIPAQELRNLCSNIKKHISNHSKIIICSKGLEIATGKVPTEIVSEFFPKENIAVLSGPNFAKEIVQGQCASASLAAYNLEIAKKIVQDLKVQNFKLYPTDELYAVQIFGSLKNVLAILCGFARGLSFGENEIASLITQGISEITNIAQKKNNREVSIANPGCVGDLILTCTSLTSRNTKFGFELSKKYIAEKDYTAINQSTIEGVFTAQSLEQLDLSTSPLLEFSLHLIGGNHQEDTSIIKKLKNILFS